MKRSLIKFIKYFLFLSILLFVYKALRDRIYLIKWDQVNLEYSFFFLAFVFLVFSRFFIGLYYYSFLIQLDYHISFFFATSACWASMIGKYLPGKVGSIAGSIYFFNRYGINPAIAMMIPLLNNVMNIFFSFLLSIPLLNLLTQFHISVFQFVTIGGLILIGVIASPYLLNYLIFYIDKQYQSVNQKNKQDNKLKRIIKLVMDRSSIDSINFYESLVKFHSKLVNRKLISLLIIIFGQCITSGISTWFIILLVEPSVKYVIIPHVISITSFAGLLGMLAIFAPAGLGVTEGAYLLLLTPIVGSENAALISVINRLLQLIVDISVSGFGFLGLFVSRKK